MSIWTWLSRLATYTKFKKKPGTDVVLYNPRHSPGETTINITKLKERLDAEGRPRKSVI